ncbi:MAG: hypothetical protein M3R17_16780 [Bacteroidota bacterium]|nr:hypothetical protein [Bacteroidota bacterium]
MRKYIFLSAAIFSVSILFSQTAPTPEDNTFAMNDLQGLLRTQLTISPAWSITGTSGDKSTSISGGRTNVYLHGTIEYYWTEHFSTRGDAFYFVNKNKINGGLKHNHSLQVGASYHFLKGMTFDPFIGVTTGISVEQIYPVTMTRGDGVTWTDYPAPAHIDPVWAPRVGMNFFGQGVFHFFVEAEYLMGNYRPAIGPTLSLNELRVSAGLGLNWVILHKEAEVRPGI